MKRRGVASPDVADALAVTFAVESVILPRSDWDGCGDQLVKHEYDPSSTNFMEPPWQHAEGYPCLREDW